MKQLGFLGLQLNTVKTALSLNQTRISWWIENIMLSNGRKIQQQEDQMIIQTDASRKGWGAHCNGISTGGAMVEKKTRTLHKCFTTNASQIYDPDFHKKRLKFNYSYPVEQQSYPIVSLQNGGYAQSRALTNQQVDLALSNFSLDHNCHRIFTKQVECPSRLESQNTSDPSDWELHQSMFQHNETF